VGQNIEGEEMSDYAPFPHATSASFCSGFVQMNGAPDGGESRYDLHEQAITGDADRDNQAAQRRSRFRDS
jgi:hypothetical protein